MAIARRWDNAIHFRPNGAYRFEECWAERLEGKRNILLITGLGWDPRMTALPKVMKSLGGEGLRDIHLILYRPSQSYRSPQKKYLDENFSVLESTVNKWGRVSKVDIITRKEGNAYVGDRTISKFYIDCDLAGYSDVLLDISALPKSLYFTLLLVLVKRIDKQYPGMNLHVVACEDVELDSQIVESPDDTRFLRGFKGTFTRISLQQVTKIWAPVLEKNYTMSLRKLYDRVVPKDIYPILPFPSRNPRTDDDLLIEYRSIFVDEWNLNPLNIIYAVEDDPLDLYRSLLSLFQKQTEALEPLGGVSMAVSALSSKLSSIGAFMAAFEGDMAVPHAIGRHTPPKTLDQYWTNEVMSRFQSHLHSVWLTGEPYE
jgi:hypothetical protein